MRAQLYCESEGALVTDLMQSPLVRGTGLYVWVGVAM